MNHDEFKEAFAGLTAIYGEKSYPLPIKSKLFHMLNRLEKNDLNRVVDNLVMEHTKAPAAGIILRACLPFMKTADARTRNAAIRELEARSGRCRDCENAGLLFVYSRANPGHEFCFKCLACDSWHVRKIGPVVPPWRKELASDYMTLREKWDLEAKNDPKAPSALKGVPRLPQKEREALRAKMREFAASIPDDDDFTAWGEL